MDKLQYDSFYKFIVSVGMVLIIAPLFCLHYLISGSYDIIMTQEDVNNLSQISSDFLNMKIYYVQIIFKYLPIVCIAFIVLGIIFALWGCIKWFTIQKSLDKLTTLNVEEKQLQIESMTPQEIAEKVLKENIETHENTDSKETSNFSYSAASLQIKRAFEVEEACFSYLKKKIGRKYYLRSNVKVFDTEYDIIASSKNDNIDLLFEIKYWTKPVSKVTLTRLLNRMEQSGIAYENNAHRNFRYIALIVSNQETIHQIKPYTENVINNKKLSFISMHFIEEKVLFSK